MKKTIILSSALIGAIFVSCSPTNSGMPLNSENNPLDSPFKHLNPLAGVENDKPAEQTTQGFVPGSWVETAMPDAEFFKKYPRFGGGSERTLPVATSAKIITYKGRFAKVELDSGEVGFLPSDMLIERAPIDELDPLTDVDLASLEALGEPIPPTEDEILERIRARENSQLNSPSLSAPAASLENETGEFIAPEPEVQGIRLPSKISESTTTIAPPTTEPTPVAPIPAPAE